QAAVRSPWVAAIHVRVAGQVEQATAAMWPKVSGASGAQAQEGPFQPKTIAVLIRMRLVGHELVHEAQHHRMIHQPLQWAAYRAARLVWPRVRLSSPAI